MTVVTGLLPLPRWLVGQLGCQKLSAKHGNEDHRDRRLHWGCEMKAWISHKNNERTRLFRHRTAMLIPIPLFEGSPLQNWTLAPAFLSFVDFPFRHVCNRS